MTTENELDIQAQVNILKANINQQFKLFIGFWIIFMQCGFALLEAGAVRSKNTTNILFKNFLDVFVGALSYWIFGYAFAYGKPGNAFIGHNYFFSTSVFHGRFTVNNVTKGLAMTRNEDTVFADEYYSSWLFQFAFAATASTIVSGAMAERTQFVAYLIYSFVITGFVYPVVSHWCWSPIGFLYTGAGTGITFIDFAGSGVVHVTGGTAALIGAKFLGPRLGRFPNKGDVAITVNDMDIAIRGHSIPLVSIGGFILFAGFLAFNGGSLQRISEYGDGTTMALAVTNTILAGSSGAMSALIFNILYRHFKGEEGYWSLLVGINGALTGMVSSCAGSSEYYPWTSVLIGAIAAVLMVIAEKLLERHKIDDPIGAVPVHLMGGLVGIIFAPVFIFKGQVVDGEYIGGLVFSAHIKSLASVGWNLFGTVCIIAWTSLNCLVLFGILKMVGLLRVTPHDEMVGLDIKKHGEPAYPETYHLVSNSTGDEPTLSIRSINSPGAVNMCVEDEITYTIDSPEART